MRITLTRGGAQLVGYDCGAGLPVVFQHGLGGGLAQVEETLEPRPGLRRLMLDCRAHGASTAGAERPFSFAMFADDVLAFVEAAGVRRFIAGGISMGAGLALRLAARHPGRVDALVLARPAWLFDPAPPNLDPHVAIGTTLGAASLSQARTMFRRSLAAMHLAQEAPAGLEAMMHWFERPDLTVTADLLTGLAGGGPGVTREEAAALKLPVLVIGHAGDPAHPLAFARALADVIPGALLVEVAPKANGTKERHLREVREAVSRFLRDRLAGEAPNTLGRLGFPPHGC